MKCPRNIRCMRELLFTLLAGILALSVSGQDLTATFNKAESLFEAERYEDASQIFTQVISDEPDNMNAYLRRGFCFSALSEYEKCAADFSVVIEHHPI